MIPIHLIESVELKDLFFLQINCKDARSFRIIFENNEQCVKWLHRLSATIICPGRIDDLFSFAFYSWTVEFKNNGHCIGSGDCNGLCHTGGLSQYSFFDEVRRLGFDTIHDESPWRITDVNSNFEICSTYPKLHVVPKAISDSDLEDVASFRCAKRFPSIVWSRDSIHEYVFLEYYPNCEVEFMNLANIHAIRKSFHSLRNLCSGPQDAFNWWSQLEKTNWLQYLSMLLKAAITVVHAVEKEGKPVVVHCSDGWDRTTQIVALAELLLDPYYRTIEVLIPSYHVRSVELWSAVYLAYPMPFSNNRDFDLPDDSPNSACSSSLSLRFPFNFSDSNLEMKSYLSTHLSSSKSDGDLIRHSSCKKCNDTHHVTNDNSLTRANNGLSTACNGDANHAVEESSCDEQTDSLYYSTTVEERDVICSPEGTTPQEMISSMTSSAATIIQEEADSDGEVTTEDSVSDTITFGRTLQEFSANSRCRQDSSSYEHLAASLNELNIAGVSGCNKLERVSDADEQGTPSKDNSTDNLTKEISIQTIENQKTITNQGTQTNDSITTLKITLSNVYACYLDNDGLTMTQNDVQDRLRQIEMLYQERMEVLHAQVLEERRRRLAGNGDVGVAGRGADLNDDVCSLPDSTQSGEQPPSHGSGDESSWIEVEEIDTEPTRWVPDHAVTKCANCDTEFWIVNRKHHCRNCGLVFCSTCSNHNLPVPDEQLYDPVRVCLSCFEKLLRMKEREKTERRTSPGMVSAVG
ncbi:hypothetical protein QZH41_020792 [Actinostola sp. cb2023]|nr:hypothetical protein QZH41_020792 [Actinostola sp. cb2023]